MKMIQALNEYIGTYTPVLKDVLDAEGNVIGQTVAEGWAGVDWPYVLSATLLIMTIYCIFRLMGGLFK